MDNTRNRFFLRIGQLGLAFGGMSRVVAINLPKLVTLDDPNQYLPATFLAINSSDRDIGGVVLPLLDWARMGFGK
jgi:hypothetical protein